MSKHVPGCTIFCVTVVRCTACSLLCCCRRCRLVSRLRCTRADILQLLTSRGVDNTGDFVDLLTYMEPSQYWKQLTGDDILMLLLKVARNRCALSTRPTCQAAGCYRQGCV